MTRNNDGIIQIKSEEQEVANTTDVFVKLYELEGGR